MTHETSIWDVVILETERLLLRTFQASDREPFASLNADPRVMEFLGAPMSFAESNAVIDRIERHFKEHGFGRMAIESRENGAFMGAAGPAVTSFEAAFTPSVEIGYRLAFEYWGYGFATEVVRAVLRHCRDTLALKDIVAFTVPANIRSRRVMEKSGMIHDPAGAFDHPRLAQGHPLRRHVLYRFPPAPCAGPRATI